MYADTQLVNVLFPEPQTRRLDYRHWIHLYPGDRVIVKQPGCPPEWGTVDDIAEDASYFWVWLDGHNRILISHGDGTTIHKILT